MIQVTDKLLRSAYASKLAYAESKQKLMHFKSVRQLHGKSFSSHKTTIINIGNTGSQAYVWKSGDQSFVVAFRGSHDFRDVLSYLDFRAETFSFTDRKVKVHRGVLSMFESIETDLTQVLTDKKTCKLPKYITFCGHSLGGAIASFASAYYGAQSNRTIDITCHTFGAPFIGDVDFLEWSRQNVKEATNIKTRSDPIPNMRLNRTYLADEERTLCVDGRLLLNPFKAHDLDTYIELLEAKTRKILSPR